MLDNHVKLLKQLGEIDAQITSEEAVNALFVNI